MTKPIIIPWIQSSCLLLCSLIASMPTEAQAQVTTDGTTSTTVTSPDGNNFTIDGGNRPEGGANLFHSFQDFSVPTGGSAAFNNALDIKNIFSRVTGGNPSSIDGLIRANGSANLFLINPAGILFGAGARLDLGGSFLGSTADSILFPEGEFSAVDLDNPPLLTINAPIGLGIRDNPAPITYGSLAESNTDTEFVGLEVPPGANLTLVAGDINFEGGKVTAAGGRVYLGGLSAAGEIGINTDGSLSFPEGVERADISLTNEAVVDVRAGGGGSIDIYARNLNLADRSELLAGIAENMGSLNAQAGNIFIDATETIFLDRRSEIKNEVGKNATGNSGDIELKTGSVSINNRSRLSGNTEGTGNAGLVKVIARDSVILSGESGVGVEERTEIRSRAVEESRGNAGRIEIETGSLILKNGARLNVGTAGTGKAGQIEIRARESVLLEGETVGNRIRGSDIISRVGENGTGDGGGIEIETSSLTLRDGARLNVQTNGKGNGGSVKITADSVLLEGETSEGRSTQIVSQVDSKGIGDAGKIEINAGSLTLRNGAQLNSSTAGTGNGGGIEIDTVSLILRDGAQLNASTDGEGNSGLIKIRAQDSVLLGNSNEDEVDRSRIQSRVNRGATGNARGIEIDTGSLILRNGAQLNASTAGEGNSGLIKIRARDSVLLEKLSGRGSSTNIQSRVQSRAKGNAAGVEITTSSLILRDGAFISGSTLGIGDGGKVTILADSILLEGISGADPEQRTSVISRVGENAIGNAPGVEITTGSFILKDGARINTQTEGVGKAGNITINADILEINTGSELSSSTFSQASAGSINIQAKDSITITGEDSGIFANTEPDSTGNGGNIAIGDSSQFAGKLTISDGAQIAVDSQGEGNGGNLSIWTKALSLNNQARLSAETMSGSGGNITLQVDENIKLKNQSTISAQAKEDANGGDIDIKANLIIASLNQNNDIIANSERGSGGNINITAEAVFGLEERSSNPPNNTNDIDASSEFGLDGTVSINTPDTSTLRETVETIEIVEPQVLSAKVCAAGGESGVSSFNVAGKGGVPPLLTAPLNADTIHIEGKPVTLQTEAEEAEVAKKEQTEPKKRKFVTLVERTEPISLEDVVPARGAIILENGDVLLTAYPTPNTVPRTPVKSANCPM